MAFTGKATYSAGATLPEIAEDVSDLIGIISPHETPLLDHLGDPRREATSTVHEWLEDSLLPNTDVIDEDSFSPDGTTATTFGVANGSYFLAGDQVRPEGSGEILLVESVSGNELTVVRGYGGTSAGALVDGQTLHILGNAALEGADTPAARFTNRVRKQNYAQIFTAGVEVSGSQLAATTIGIEDELQYQMQERLRELIRDLENCVINGVAPAADVQGSGTVRRTMNGILNQLSTHVNSPGDAVLPLGDGGSANLLNEAILNTAMRAIWEQSSANVDTIVCHGVQKRRINQMIGDRRGFMASDTKLSDLVSVYESDFGVARVVVSRWVPKDTVLLLDSSRIGVLPLAGRSFQFKRLASGGDSELGQVIGEYTLEMRNEAAHGAIVDLGTSF
jgi:hypothetical protein